MPPALWEDEEFPADDTSIYKSVEKLEPERLGFNHKWLRPSEFAPGGLEPRLFAANPEELSLVTGRLNDGWLLGAMGLVFAHRGGRLIRNLFVSPPPPASEGKDDGEERGWQSSGEVHGLWLRNTASAETPV